MFNNVRRRKVSEGRGKEWRIIVALYFERDCLVYYRIRARRYIVCDIDENALTVFECIKDGVIAIICDFTSSVVEHKQANYLLSSGVDLRTVIIKLNRSRSSANRKPDIPNRLHITLINFDDICDTRAARLSVNRVI